MDGRRHRALLKFILAAGLFAGAIILHAQGPASPVPSVAVPPPAPAASVSPDAAHRHTTEKAMAERRQREQATSEQEAQQHIEQLPSEQQAAFRRNLGLWNGLSEADRENIRRMENERKRAEVEKAYQQSGLHLDKDQREVFGLRYRQERRKLERELQEKIEAERARRLPELVDGLKREFTEKPAVLASPTVVAKPSPSVSVPAAPPTASR